MINDQHIRGTALMYFICSYILAFTLWFQGVFYLQMVGWTLFFYNNYQIIYELYLNQHSDEN